MKTLINFFTYYPEAILLVSIVALFLGAVIYMAVDLLVEDSTSKTVKKEMNAVFINNGLVDEFEDIEPEPKSTVPESSNNEN
jgi:hypothetical protein